MTGWWPDWISWIHEVCVGFGGAVVVVGLCVVGLVEVVGRIVLVTAATTGIGLR